jgi:hypothetical protein
MPGTRLSQFSYTVVLIASKSTPHCLQKLLKSGAVPCIMWHESAGATIYGVKWKISVVFSAFTAYDTLSYTYAEKANAYQFHHQPRR